MNLLAYILYIVFIFLFSMANYLIDGYYIVELKKPISKGGHQTRLMIRLFSLFVASVVYLGSTVTWSFVLNYVLYTLLSGIIFDTLFIIGLNRMRDKELYYIGKRGWDEFIRNLVDPRIYHVVKIVLSLISFLLITLNIRIDAG